MLLSEIWRRIIYRWKTVCIVLIISVLSALVVATVNGTNYSAKTVLTVNPLTINPFSTATANQQINIATERAILSSGEVARMAAKSLGEDISAALLSQNASIEAPQGSQVLTVTVVDSNAERAAQKANALATAYLAFRSEGASQVANTYIKAIDKRIAELDQAAKNGSASSLVLSDLINQRNDLALVAENPGRIIGFADASDLGSYPGITIYLAAGLTGGLILGLLAAVFKDRVSRKTENAQRLAERTGKKIISMTEPTDMEGIRWVVRSLQIDSGAQTRRHRRAIGVLSLGQTSETRFRALLAHVLEARNIRCHSQSLASVTPGDIDRGWPEGFEQNVWPEAGAVLIGIPPGIENARVAVLCDRFMDAAAIFVDASTPLLTVQRQLETCSGIDPESLCLVFVEKHRKRRERELWPVIRTEQAGEKMHTTTTVEST
ncbi:hypothetical protein CQ018_14105 [Arthrobacter sp. MYb227]|nr:hypothetical protein CQ018_14105 [Arthrobacter sp. MYb227]